MFFLESIVEGMLDLMVRIAAVPWVTLRESARMSEGKGNLPKEIQYSF